MSIEVQDLGGSDIPLGKSDGTVDASTPIALLRRWRWPHSASPFGLARALYQAPGIESLCWRGPPGRHERRYLITTIIEIEGRAGERESHPLDAVLRAQTTIRNHIAPARPLDNGRRATFIHGCSIRNEFSRSWLPALPVCSRTRPPIPPPSGDHSHPITTRKESPGEGV